MFILSWNSKALKDFAPWTQTLRWWWFVVWEVFLIGFFGGGVFVLTDSLKRWINQLFWVTKDAVHTWQQISSGYYSSEIGKFLVPSRSELFYLVAFLKQNGVFQSFVSVFDTQKYKTSQSVSSYSYKNTEVNAKWWQICSCMVKMEKGQLKWSTKFPGFSLSTGSVWLLASHFSFSWL